jgi:hypothetical protein
MTMKRTLLLAALLVVSLGNSAWAGDENFDQDNVVVVLDASGSMSKAMRGTRISRMDAAKQALLAVLDHMPANAKVGILVFSGSDPKYKNWVYPLGPMNKSAMRKAILGPKPGGGTPLADYMKIGADRLLKEREKQFGYGSYRLLAVTDGVADSGQRVAPYAQDILARGITLDAIGVDMKQDHILAKLAHSYRRANDPASLKKAVSEIFAEVGGTDAKSLQGVQDDFEIVGSLSPDLALSIIQALAASGNHPIGTPAPAPPAKTEAASSAPNSSPQAGNSSHSPASPGHPVENAGKKAAKKKGQSYGVFLMLGLFAFLFFGSSRASKGKR